MGFKKIFVGLLFLLQWYDITDSHNLNRSKLLTVLKSVKSLHPQQVIQLIWTTSPETEWRDLHDAVWTSKSWKGFTNNIYFIRLEDSLNTIVFQLSSNIVNIMVNPTFPVVKYLVPFICKNRKILYLADESSREWLNQCSIPINCAVYTVLTRDSLFEAYNISTDVISRVLSMKDMSGLFRRRSNLSGLKFKVASLLKFKPEEQNEDKDQEYLLQAYYHNLFYAVQELSNFIPVLTDAATVSYGQELENGAWTGLIGMLQRKEIDMGLAYMAISADKLKVMDITTYIMNDVFQLYIRTPPRDYSWRSFITPFRFSSWVAVLAACILLPLAHFGLLRLSRGFDGYEQENMISDSYMMVIRGICNQGSGVAGYSWTMKILDLIVLSWGCVTMSFYAKILYSQFATVRVELPYSDLSEILNADNNRYNIMTFKNGLVYTIAMTSSDGEMKSLWEKHLKIPDNQYTDVGRALKLFCIEDRILFTPKKITEPLMNSTNCSISVIPGKYFPFIAGFGLPKNSPYTSIINYCIFHLREAGILSYLEKKYMTMHESTVGDDLTLQIDLNHTFPIFCGFFLLILFSCVILQIEILFHRIYRQNVK